MRITIRINPNIGDGVFLSVIHDEIPIKCISKNNLEMWR